MMTPFQRSRSPRVGVLRVALAAAMLFCLPAAAQIVRVPAEVAQSVTLSPDQEAIIDQFVDSLRADLFGADKAASSRAVGELLDPLRDDRVSVAFRQALASRLIGDIEAALNHSQPLLEDGTLNATPYVALRIAGDLATDRTLAVIVQNLEHEDPGIRFFAIHCTEAVFFAVRTAAPAVSDRALFADLGQGRAEGLAPKLGELLVTEPSPRHAAAIVRSLAEAASVRPDQIGGLSVNAVRQIAEQTSRRIRRLADAAPTEEERLVWLTAAQAVQRAVAQGSQLGVDAPLGAVRLAGHLTAAIYRDVEAGRATPAADRSADGNAEIEKQTLALAQNLLLFGEQRHAEATGRRRNQALETAAGGLLDAFVGQGDRNFRQSALAIISTNGLLTDAPYAFADDEFIR
jgi:hypothetical protein